MRFPITREQLQDIKKSVEDEIIEYNINSIVESIQYRIIGRAYSFCHQQYTGGAISAVTVNHSDSWSYNPTKLKIDINPNSRFEIPNKLKHNINYISLAASNPWRTHFEIIKQKLMELFPGVSFETDPLKTYMLVDWS
jgi:hypothetical protein